MVDDNSQDNDKSLGVPSKISSPLLDFKRLRERGVIL